MPLLRADIAGSNGSSLWPGAAGFAACLYAPFLPAPRPASSLTVADASRYAHLIVFTFDFDLILERSGRLLPAGVLYREFYGKYRFGD